MLPPVEVPDRMKILSREDHHYSTISFPLNIPIPQVKVYSPGFSGVNSMGVV
jgi:phosphoribosylcarboxyaminoimidazole (NCAIR) mutase